MILSDNKRDPVRGNDVATERHRKNNGINVLRTDLRSDLQTLFPPGLIPLNILLPHLTHFRVDAIECIADVFRVYLQDKLHFVSDI